MMPPSKKLSTAWIILKITYGAYFLIIGIDKFFGLVTESQNRVSSLTLKIIPCELATLLALVGIVEIVIGGLLLSRWTSIGAYSAFALMALITGNLLFLGKHYDITLHAFAVTAGAFALGQLSSLMQKN